MFLRDCGGKFDFFHFLLILYFLIFMLLKNVTLTLSTENLTVNYGFTKKL